MSGKRSISKILKDATGVAFALSKIIVGQTLTGSENGILGFSFRDSDGKPFLPQFNSENALPVTLDAGTCKPFLGKVLEGALTEDVEALVATLVLTASKDYSNTEVIMSSTREFSYRITNTDDADGTPVETDVAEGIMGDGDLHKNVMPAKHCFTAGSTGTQELRIYATPIDKDPDDIYAHGSANEIA